ncbi:MAG: acyl-CoA dehydrogenase [Rhizobiales bacterium]|nr:acyl-CoA dehydrogenase [Hyphomicrobiales bacterium]NRB13442.1 acyl-CoA dehydrogenase [Hyphomicrobiales bacterium]
MTYKAPINDIKFTFDYMTEFTELVKAGKFADLSDDLIDAVLNEAAKFAENEIAPLNRVGDVEGAKLISHNNDYNEVKTATGWGKTYKNWCDAGWASLPHNPEYGGQGLPGILAVATTEMWNAASMAFGIGPVLTQGAADTIENLGTEAQKATYLEQIVAGNWTATMNLTEPDVGSDLGNLACKAVRDNEGEFKLFGTKIFITYGEHDVAENIIHLVLARIENAPKGVKGLSLFIVPKFLVNKDGSLGQRNDLEAVGLEHKMGIHASPTCTMEFGGNTGATAYLIGEENKGINAMFMLMNNARLMVGTQGVAISDRAYQHALNYANTRTQGRRADTPKGKMTLIKNHPDVQHMLLKQRSYTLASRALCYATALNLDLTQQRGDEAQLNADFLTPIAKGFATDMGVEVASLGVQIHGGMGFIEEAGAAQHYRDARIASIYEGTNGIQAMDLVGRKLKMDNGATAIRHLDAVLTTAEDIMQADLPFGKTAYRLKDAAKAAKEATLWLLAAEDSDLPLAAATNYLRLMGLVLGAHYIAKGAFKAAGKIANDSEYLYLAQFFAECLLPEVLALKKIVIDGSETLLQAPPTMFDI